MPRAFRSQESYAAEHTTRDMLRDFLLRRGFKGVVDKRTPHGSTESQVLHATDETGNQVAMWVRLCWRGARGKRSSTTYSAAQLLARIKNDDWVGTLTEKMKRVKADGATHLLLVQRDGKKIIHAAAVPIASVVPIWIRQRDISKRLIAQGKLSGRTKNHAMNGSSPTLWLQDDKAPEVAQALWNYRGVRDLESLPLVRVTNASIVTDDSIDDLPGVDFGAIGSDGAPSVLRMTSGVKRDPKVRDAVRAFCGGKCEREGCGEHRDYAGFLDVHHILGAGKGDRVFNCIALCPNCHREAHAAPDRDAINSALLKTAALHKSKVKS